jgi:hypothetical protein
VFQPLLLAQETDQGLQVVPCVLRQGLPVAGDLEKVDVHVPGGTRPLPEPAELLLEVLHHRLGEHPRHLRQGRAGPADRHPEVVEELGVQVLDHPLLVRLHGVQKASVNGPDGLMRSKVRVQVQLEGGRVVPGGTTQGFQDHPELTPVLGFQVKRPPENGEGLLELPLVALQGNQLQPGGNGARLAGVRKGRLAFPYPDTHHRLVVLVKKGELLHVPADTGLGEKPPDAGDALQRFPEGTRRQVPAEVGDSGRPSLPAPLIIRQES